MTTTSQDRSLGLALIALLAAFGGDLLGVNLLVAIGVTGFSVALAALFALMTVSFVVGLSRTSGPDMRDPVLVDRAY